MNTLKTLLILLFPMFSYGLTSNDTNVLSKESGIGGHWYFFWF